MSERPPVELTLVWDGDLRFRGAATDGREVVLDGDARAAISPVEALGFALASCMGADLVHILRKQRAELRGCEVRFSGRRAQTEPRRYLAVELSFVLRGAVEPGHVERALALSQEKYCSVWHSLRQDVEMTVRYDISK
ncbi:MAG TPA: OsmC family protein [Vicinamibacteria bacterium]|nr:OsmC family protein [Vicinamibacteria bacterium]